MHRAYFRFYEELNDFLPPVKRKKKFTHEFIDRTSVKDMIESLGVPHTEIDLILVNGLSVSFNYIVQDKDDISVYPVFESLDITNLQKLRPAPLRIPKFILDVHLGRLAKYMRILGFDTLYKNDYTNDEIVITSLKEKRTILTKDRGILKRKEVTHGYWVRNTDPNKQIKEIIGRFDLKNSIKEFTLCLECNSPLKPILKEKVIDSLPQKVRTRQNEFFICGNCNKIFWKGTHYDKMLRLVNKITKED